MLRFIAIFLLLASTAWGDCYDKETRLPYLGDSLPESGIDSLRIIVHITGLDDSTDWTIADSYIQAAFDSTPRRHTNQGNHPQDTTCGTKSSCLQPGHIFGTL